MKTIPTITKLIFLITLNALFILGIGVLVDFNLKQFLILFAIYFIGMIMGTCIEHYLEQQIAENEQKIKDRELKFMEVKI